MNPTLRSLLRFWWLVLAGLILGVLAGYLTLSAKTNKKYVATAKIFVNAPSGPFFRTADTTVTRQNPRPRIVHQARGGTPGSASTSVQLIKSAPVVVSGAPDTETLVNAANLYPLLIESDEVAAIKPGPSDCVIEATGVFASTNTFGVFKASPVPVVAVKSTCKAKGDAMVSSQTRVDGFQTWVVKQQNVNRIPRKQRLLVQELTAPAKTLTIGGPSAGLPVFVGVVVFLFFCGLAILLDRPRPDHEDEDEDEDRSAPRPAAPPTPSS